MSDLYCPTCRAALDLRALVTFDHPIDHLCIGDWTVCRSCTSILILLNHDTFRLVTQYEFEQIDPIMQSIVSDYQSVTSAYRPQQHLF